MDKNHTSDPLTSSKHPTLSHLFQAESGSRSGAYRHHVKEAARYVFCVYHGIEVSAIRETRGQLIVHSNAEHISSRSEGLPEYIQMLLAGAVAVQIIFGGENQEMVDAMTEAERVYSLAQDQSFSNDGRFESIVQKASRNALLHLADPKLRAAIGIATRFPACHRSRVSQEEMDDLKTLVTGSLM
jgi:hypothetical protein